VAGLLLVAGAAACTPADVVNDDGAARCYGGLGIAVQVTVGACPMPAELNKTQITLVSAGAEHAYDYIRVQERAAFPWPVDFFDGDPAHAQVLVYAEEGPCRATGAADFVIDPETCTPVVLVATCTCAAP
jgi:hypothetical protein